MQTLLSGGIKVWPTDLYERFFATIPDFAGNGKAGEILLEKSNSPPFGTSPAGCYGSVFIRPSPLSTRHRRSLQGHLRVHLASTASIRGPV
jgi:hypothetical protein